MERHPAFAQKYKEFMEDYERLGHMSESDFQFDTEHYVIPHHGIFKRDSDKIRVVFDGSCKTTNGVSLNQCLHSGEALQNDITKILINFRRHQVVFTTDVKQMFRMTWIHPEDRRYQLILWRSDPSQELKVYELNTNTYGLRSSPYVTIRTLLELAAQWMEAHPDSKAADVVRDAVFVDDILTGADSIEEAEVLKTELIELMRSAGYELRKWSTNEPYLLRDLPEDHCDQPREFDANDPKSFIKVLGIQWEPISDTMSYRINIPSDKAVTKRSILSTIARLYDPCGYCAPVIIRFKNLLQELFMDGLHWDEAVPEATVENWKYMIDDLYNMERLKIPRCLALPNAVSYTLHGFGDASEAGYAACIYLRSEDARGNVKVNLVMAKSKVAPIKTRQTIPKLELSAAHLVCQLLNHVADGYEKSIKIDTLYAWSDSSIVLAWVETQPHCLQTFECNRVQFIQNSPRKLNWRHVPSDLNPADCASRGLSAEDLIHHPLWWTVPWLGKEEFRWPNKYVRPAELPGFKRVVNTNVVQLKPWDISLLERVSSFTKLINTTGYVLRFIRNLRTDKLMRPESCILSLSETRDAVKYWIKRIQELEYETEIRLLKQQKRVITSLQKLSVFLDSEGVIRVGGRLRHSELTYGARHPVLLPKDTKFVQLLMEHYHKTYCHIGANGLIAILRREYWITSVRKQAARTIRRCKRCFRFSVAEQPPRMADLPADRVCRARPFNGVATDFAGPYMVKSSLLRNAKSVKTYFCVFVCVATKAVHVELVSSLSVEAFIAAFTRFVSRRGLPSLIRSDRGTNFVGANKYLKEVNQFLLEKEHILKEQFRRQHIHWEFNPPASPHMGGLFEAAVKSVKQLLKREIGDTIMTFEELSTLLCTIEAILNSRPLVAMSEDPGDLEVLTPGHFLIGQPLVAVPVIPWSETKMSRLSRFQMLQKLQQNIWARWHLEYLSTLQSRNKWYHDVDNLNINDLVFIKDENTPPLHWKLGRVIELHRGKDNVIRSVRLRTQSGELVRPVVKLFKLPVETD
ncbi:hypothetical protein PYW07_007268 [Mythimna separata]|uniref:Integrase catalytic domain-containing protein n=1 Tax=Mythimna separata TaxID=271217 RepID=A0AAD7Z0R3_MYTSE|nr:hypothetical protein PYW07_007268 [Mythimna separata]